MLKSPWTKALVWLLCLAPLAKLVWNGFHGQLTLDPTKYIEHYTGDWTINLIVATLAITPLRRLLGLPDLIRFRRLIGLFAFFYVCLHFTTYLWIDQNFDFHAIWGDIAKRPYITVGFTGFVLLIPLAVTSTKGWIRRMGGKNWQRLHRLIYVTAIAGVVHYYWLVKSDVRMPLLYATIVGALLLYRVLMKFQAAKRVAAMAAVLLALAAVGHAADVIAPGVVNFHQVNAGIYRGAQPSDAGYRSLAKIGVKVVMDLRNQGDDEARERKAVESAGMKYVSIPLGELSAPNPADLRRALDILEQQKDGPVFLHCRRGKDRTGTVVACYRIEHDGWNNEKALAEARSYGMSWLEVGMERFISHYRVTPQAVAAPAN